MRMLKQTAKKLNALGERNARIIEMRVHAFQRAAEDGSLEKFLKVALPVSAGISLLGTYNGNESIYYAGIGALIMGALYSLAILKR